MAARLLDSDARRVAAVADPAEASALRAFCESAEIEWSYGWPDILDAWQIGYEAARAAAASRLRVARAALAEVSLTPEGLAAAGPFEGEVS